MIFVDTSAFYALEVEDDVNHVAARRFLREVREGRYRAMLTTDYVLDEALTLLKLRHGAQVALKFLEKVGGSRSIKVVWIGEDIFQRALEYFKRDGRFKWSFTDCTSFAVMTTLGVECAFTFDENFEQAGFTKLP